MPAVIEASRWAMSHAHMCSGFDLGRVDSMSAIAILPWSEALVGGLIPPGRHNFALTEARYCVVCTTMLGKSSVPSAASIVGRSF